MVWHQESGLLCYVVVQMQQAAHGVTPAEEPHNWQQKKKREKVTLCIERKDLDFSPDGEDWLDQTQMVGKN